MARGRVPLAVNMRCRCAGRAEVPVFVARGLGLGCATAELRSVGGVRVVDSPRHATVLLAAGEFPGRMGEALDRVHDQLPHPRGVVWWRPPHAAAVPPALHDAAVAYEPTRVADVVRTVHRRCVEDQATTADVAPDRPPNDFAGRGSNGQGGDGMMGGTPWGRPMAMTADDRDGLQLDRLAVTFGPFTPAFPPGLFADVRLQGEIVQAITFAPPDADADAEVGWAAARSLPFSGERHLLHVLSDIAWLGGLPAAARRAARLAGSLRQGTTSPSAGELGRVRQQFRRSGFLRQWTGIGHLDGSGDVARRVAVMLDPSAAPVGDPLSIRDMEWSAIGRALIGMDWSDALMTIASLDLAGNWSGASISALRRL